jgi:predicted membrane protein
MSMMEIQKTSIFPEIQPSLGRTIILSGLAANITWEIWARLITPLWVGGPLEPAALVQSVFGFNNLLLAEAIHAIVGIVFYPIGYLFIARPLQRLIVPKLPLLLTGIGSGIGLWIFALYVMAHLFGGQPAFLGFVTLTWASLIGHMLFGTVVAFVVRRMER